MFTARNNVCPKVELYALGTVHHIMMQYPEYEVCMYVCLLFVTMLQKSYDIHNCMQGCAPLYFRELLVKQANTRTLRSNTKNLLQIPLTNLKRFSDRAFCAYAPRLWNELPDNIKAADSVQNFKKPLKTLLFRKGFNLLYGP